MTTRTKRNHSIRNNTFTRLLLIAAMSLVPAVAQSSQTPKAQAAEVRSMVKNVFDQLKSKNYSALYDFLPSTSRTRMSRERFVSALQRTQDFYQLDRMEIGSLRISGNWAIVDTVFYGSIVSPIQAEGKIVAQQFLVREDGKWRVATGDQSAVKKFLSDNPAFGGKGFKLQEPRVYRKQGDAWVEFKVPRGSGKKS